MCGAGRADVHVVGFKSGTCMKYHYLKDLWISSIIAIIFRAAIALGIWVFGQKSMDSEDSITITVMHLT